MLKILLVDDEATEREGIEFLIKRYEFPLNIAKAVNGKEALAIFKGKSYRYSFYRCKDAFHGWTRISKGNL